MLVGEEVPYGSVSAGWRRVVKTDAPIVGVREQGSPGAVALADSEEWEAERQGLGEESEKARKKRKGESKGHPGAGVAAGRGGGPTGAGAMLPPVVGGPAVVGGGPVAAVARQTGSAPAALGRSTEATPSLPSTPPNLPPSALAGPGAGAGSRMLAPGAFAPDQTMPEQATPGLAGSPIATPQVGGAQPETPSGAPGAAPASGAPGASPGGAAAPAGSPAHAAPSGSPGGGGSASPSTHGGGGDGDGSPLADLADPLSDLPRKYFGGRGTRAPRANSLNSRPDANLDATGQTPDAYANAIAEALHTAQEYDKLNQDVKKFFDDWATTHDDQAKQAEDLEQKTLSRLHDAEALPSPQREQETAKILDDAADELNRLLQQASSAASDNASGLTNLSNQFKDHPPGGRGLADAPSGPGNGKGPVWPVEGGRLTSGYGMRHHPITGQEKFHDGIDQATPVGTPLHAMAHGTVIDSGWHNGYGYTVRMRYDNGAEVFYAHMNHPGAAVGTDVDAGTLVGYSGNAGASTGPHVHIGASYQGHSVDPRWVFQMLGGYS